MVSEVRVASCLGRGHPGTPRVRATCYFLTVTVAPGVGLVTTHCPWICAVWPAVISIHHSFKVKTTKIIAKSSGKKRTERVDWFSIAVNNLPQT